LRAAARLPDAQGKLIVERVSLSDSMLMIWL